MQMFSLVPYYFCFTQKVILKTGKESCVLLLLLFSVFYIFCCFCQQSVPYNHTFKILFFFTFLGEHTLGGSYVIFSTPWVVSRCCWKNCYSVAEVVKYETCSLFSVLVSCYPGYFWILGLNAL